jgi:glycosyltransferase involved in cell wall biosynthesis
MKILWLCSWYPNKVKPFDGDFIQRQARAVALLHEVHVIHVVKDDQGKTDKPISEETVVNGNLSETIIYYKQTNTGLRFLNRILSGARHRKLFINAAERYVHEYPEMKLIHVHVAMKAGVIALSIKKKYGIPFIVSEHWSGFLEKAKPDIAKQSWLIRVWMKKIFKEAVVVTTVSAKLAAAIRKHFDVKKIIIVPNVVDTGIFYPVTRQPGDKTGFIHISSMNPLKNMDQILAAFGVVKKINANFSLTLFVPSAEKLHDLVMKHELDGVVEIHEEVPQSVLATSMQQADALILYSNYETFGCVVIEANACGVPAILSELEVFREHSVEGETALFVPGDNIEALASTFLEFMNQKWKFDSSAIAKRTHGLFSYPVIAQKFDAIYRSLTPAN